MLIFALPMVLSFFCLVFGLQRQEWWYPGLLVIGVSVPLYFLLPAFFWYAKMTLIPLDPFTPAAILRVVTVHLLWGYASYLAGRLWARFRTP
jgi:hypothetical protein